MILVADSGSSKTDWRVLGSKGEVVQFQTVGLNPYHHTRASILDVLQASDFIACKDKISDIYFYGAGCGTNDSVAFIRDTLSSFFINAKVVVVHDDLMAVAKAFCNDKAGIVAILGTGANVGFYDGVQMRTKDISLGYILGDEGSAAYFGKVLLQKFFTGKFSDKLRNKFIHKYKDFNRAFILNNVYQKPFASRFLGEFTHFLSENIEDTFCEQMIRQGFQSFIDNYIKQIPDYNRYPFYFVGSVAMVFQKILEEVFQTNQLSMATVAQKPIEHLTKYHLARFNQ